MKFKKIQCLRNSLLGATPPPLGHPPFAIVLYYLFGNIAMRPVPLGGLVAQEGGEHVSRTSFVADKNV